MKRSNLTELADALVSGIRRVVAGNRVRSARSQQTTQVDVLAPATEPPRLAVAEVPPVDAVAHPVVQTRTVGARTVQLAVVAVKPRPTPARVVGVGQVPAETVVLARRRRARVVARTVAAVEAVVAEAVVVGVGDDVATVAAVLARLVGASVGVLAQLAEEIRSALAPFPAAVSHRAAAAVLTSQDARALGRELAAVAEVLLRTCALKFSGFRRRRRQRRSAVLA